MQHRISVKAVFALAAVTAPALLVAFAPASGLASTVRLSQVPKSPNYAGGWLARPTRTATRRPVPRSRCRL